MTPETETTLRFTGGYSPLPVVLIAFGLAVAMWFLYRRELKFVTSRYAKVPAVLRSVGRDDFLYLLMPVRVTA